MRTIVTALLASALSSGCASIYSRSSVDTKDQGDGLAYYVPKQDFILTITIPKESSDNDSSESVAASLSAAYPDYSHRFVLTHGSSWIVSNEAAVTIKNGLLTSTKSATTSQVPEILMSIADTAGTVGTIRSMSKSQDPRKPSTCGPGVHVFRLRPEERLEYQNLCGYNVKVERIEIDVPQDETFDPSTAKPEGAPSITSSNAKTDNRPHQRQRIARADDSDRPGVFYRLPAPYVISIEGPVRHQAILLSPNESPVLFLPISRTFFAKNTAEFGFIDGMPTQFDQKRDSELVALLKIPASIIGSYFSAVGRIFDSFKDRDVSESDALASSTNLELAKLKYSLCLKSIKANDQAAVTQLECGK